MKQHYEKVITICCFLFIFTNLGMVSTSFGVYQPYIVQIVGDTGGMLVLATRTLVALVAIMFVDRYYRLLDCRMGIFVATMLSAVGLAVYSYAGSLPAFLAAAVLTGIGYGFGGMVGMTMLTRRWYTDRVGTAVGFAAVGSGIAGIVVPLVAVRIVENVSLHASFLLESVLAFAVGFIVLALLRNYPEDVGLRRDAAGSAASTASAPDRPAGSGKRASAEQAPIGARMSRPEYRRVIAAAVCVGIMTVGGPAYVTVYFTDAGISPVLVASLFSLEGVFLTASKFATGRLFDAMGAGRGSAVMFSFIIAGLGCLCAVGLGATAIAPVAVVIYGIGLSLGTVGISVWSLDMANPQNLTRSIKNFQVAYSLGGFLTNTFPGPLKEITGSYLSLYVILLAASVFAAMTIVGTYRKYRGGNGTANGSAERDSGKQGAQATA